MPKKNNLMQLPTFSVKSLVLIMVLATAALLGNYFAVRLFPGVEILFGSIAVLMAARLLGTPPALFVGVVSIIPLLGAWILPGSNVWYHHHPFGPVLYGGEALAVILICRFTRNNIVTLDVIYWLLIGMPATVALNYWVGSGNGDLAVYYAVRNGVNGSVNAMVAYVLIQLPVVLGWRGIRDQKISLRQALFVLLATVALLPTLILSAYNMHQQQSAIERAIAKDSSALLEELSQKSALQLQSNLVEMTALLKEHDDHGARILTVLDKDGRIIAASRPDLVPGTIYLHKHGGDVSLDSLLSNGEILSGGLSVVTPVFAAHSIYSANFYYERTLMLSADRVLLLEMSAQSYQREMKQIFFANVVWVTVLTILLFLFARLVSHKFADPIFKLSEASADLKTKVNRGIRLQFLPSSIDEIDRLNNNFSDMAEGLRESFEALEHARDTLEENVHSRTLELRKTISERESQKFAIDQHAIVAITDTAGKIIYANDRFCVLSQYSREELIGQNHRIINSGFHPSSFFVDMWKTLAQGKVWRGEVCNRKKDGSLYWLETTIVPFLDEDGKPLQYVALRTDITALLQANQEAERASNAKSEFISRMSHELRTPLNAVLGYAQLMKYDKVAPLQPTQLANVESIIKGGWHQLELVNDILDISRIEASKILLHPECLIVSPVVQECVELQAPLAEERQITVDVQVSDCEDCVVWADRTRFKQVLINLLSNAVKYNHEGGQVTVKSSKHESGRNRISVTDTGMGIPAYRLEELFIPFNRLDSDISGAGVGLAVSKRLVEAMGGEIGVESTVGVGTTFWFELPGEEQRLEARD